MRKPYRPCAQESARSSNSLPPEPSRAVRVANPAVCPQGPGERESATGTSNSLVAHRQRNLSRAGRHARDLPTGRQEPLGRANRDYAVGLCRKPPNSSLAGRRPCARRSARRGATRCAAATDFASEADPVAAGSAGRRSAWASGCRCKSRGPCKSCSGRRPAASRDKQPTATQVQVEPEPASAFAAQMHARWMLPG